MRRGAGCHRRRRRRALVFLRVDRHGGGAARTSTRPAPPCWSSPRPSPSDLVEAEMGGTDLNERLHLMTMQILSRPRLSRIIDDLGPLRGGVGGDDPRGGHRADARAGSASSRCCPSWRRSCSPREQRDRDQHLPPLLPPREPDAGGRRGQPPRPTTSSRSTSRSASQISADTSEFIEAELARLAVQIQEVEARIAQVKNENPGRLPEDLSANQRLYERTIEQTCGSRSATWPRRESDEALLPPAGAHRRRTTGRSRPARMPERRLELLRAAARRVRCRGASPRSTPT